MRSEERGLDAATQRLKHQTQGGEIAWRLSPLVLGLEYRHIPTTYCPGSPTVDQVNPAVGAEFWADEQMSG
jgi:hypothetical protein